jgi:hypothetical protein
LEQFYEPVFKEKSKEGIKVFPKQIDSNKESILTPSGGLPSIGTVEDIQ